MQYDIYGMHDFARASKKNPGFAVSPFTVYKQQQQWRVFGGFFQKVSIGFLFLGLNLFFSLSLLSFYFFHSASLRGDTPVGIAILTSEKGQILKDTNIVWIDPSKKEMSLFSIPGSVGVHTAQSGAYTLTALYGLYALDHATPEDFLKAFVRNVRIDA